jgi:S1-C subfamily serine protease
VSRVLPGTAADLAGVRVGDRIVQFAGRPIEDGELFRSLVLTAENPVPVVLERGDATEPIQLSVNLVGKPVRLGLSWRSDDCEPGTLVITRVVPGSPAERAGLQVADRILGIGGRTFANAEEFQQIASGTASPIELSRERMGQIRPVKLEIPAEAGVLSASRSPPRRPRLSQ